MASTGSVPPPTAIDSNGSRRGQPQTYSSPSRTHSTRSRASAVPPSPQRASSSYSRPPTTSSRPVEEILPQRDYETTNVAQSTRRRSTDRPPAVRTESSRSASGHHHRSSSRHHYAPSDMSGTTATNNGGGPAPVVTPVESRHGSSKPRTRTTVPAKTGNWILGKTIGAGSMGKVKLAKRAEGGEQVRV